MDAIKKTVKLLRHFTIVVAAASAFVMGNEKDPAVRLPIAERELREMASALDAESGKIYISINRQDSGRLLDTGHSESEFSAIHDWLEQYLRHSLAEVGVEAVFGPRERQGMINISMRIDVDRTFYFTPVKTSATLPDIPGSRIYLDPRHPYVDIEIWSYIRVNFYIANNWTSAHLPARSEIWIARGGRKEFRVRLSPSDLPMNTNDLWRHNDIRSVRQRINRQLNRSMTEVMARSIKPAVSSIQQETPSASLLIQRVRGTKKYSGETDIEPGDSKRFAAQLKDLKTLAGAAPILAVHLAREGILDGYLWIEPDQEEGTAPSPRRREFAIALLVMRSLIETDDYDTAWQLWEEGLPGTAPAGLAATFICRRQRPGGEEKIRQLLLKGKGGDSYRSAAETASRFRISRNYRDQKGDMYRAACSDLLQRIVNNRDVIRAYEEICANLAIPESDEEGLLQAWAEAERNAVNPHFPQHEEDEPVESKE